MAFFLHINLNTFQSKEVFNCFDTDEQVNLGHRHCHKWSEFCKLCFSINSFSISYWLLTVLLSEYRTAASAEFLGSPATPRGVKRDFKAHTNKYLHIRKWRHLTKQHLARLLATKSNRKKILLCGYNSHWTKTAHPALLSNPRNHCFPQSRIWHSQPASLFLNKRCWQDAQEFPFWVP